MPVIPDSESWGKLSSKDCEFEAVHPGLTPVILATQKAEITRIRDPTQPGQTVHERPCVQKKPITKKGWWSGSRWRHQVSTPVPHKKKVSLKDIEEVFLNIH
jgi:hypothetical protein